MNAADPPGWLVRAAAVPDARAIAAVHVATWRDAYAGLMPDEILDGLDVDQRAETWRGRLADPPEGMFVFVAALGGEVRGFVSGGPSRDGGSGGEVYALYVDPGSQGRGAGRRLLRAAAECLAGAGFNKARLWVFADNLPARHFYESQGWQPYGAEEQWTYPGSDASLTDIRYVRNLDLPG